MKNRLRKINFPLLMGSVIVVYLIMMSLYPQMFTSRDPVYEESPKYIEYKVDGKIVEKLSNNPMPPNKDNIFGTDDGGRDVYARLVYGTRSTMKLALLIALLRMIMALPLGVAAGIGVKPISNIIKVFNTFFTAIPMLIFSFIVLKNGYFRQLQIDESIIAFAVVLSLVGWAKLAGIIEDSTRLVMEEDFIEGEIAIGKTKLQIAYQNVLPHIIPTSISLFFKEMGMALFLIAQLAVLYVFVGVTRQIEELAFRANYFMNLEPEWGGSLSRISVNIKSFDKVYWMVLYPVVAFTLAIMGLNLTGEGLRIEFQKRDSRVISSIKKFTYAISPRVFMSQIRNFKVYYKPVIIKVSAIIVIATYFIIPWNPSAYDFNIEGAKGHLQELTSSKYEGRAAGTEGGHLAGDYIIETLKSYGYQVSVDEIPLSYTPEINPVTGSLSVNTIDVLSPMTIENGWITIIGEDGNEKTFNLHNDFTITTVGKEIFQNEKVSEIKYKGIAADDENVGKIDENTDFFYIKKYISWFDGRMPGESNSISTGGGKSRTFDIQFTMEEGYASNHNAGLYNFTTIIPFGELAKELESGYKNIEITFDYPKVAEYEGRNITAFLPGKDKTEEKPGNVVIIGAAYDGVYVKDGEKTYAMTGTPAAIALEFAKTIMELKEPLNKSLQFIFWDNEYDVTKFSIKDGSYFYPIQNGQAVDMALDHGYYYFDISYSGYSDDESLNLITYPGERNDSSIYLMGLEMQERMKELNIDFKRLFYGSFTKGINNMELNARSSVGLGNPWTWGINSPIDTIENVNYKRMEEIGQIILDTLTMNQYMVD